MCQGSDLIANPSEVHAFVQTCIERERSISAVRALSCTESNVNALERAFQLARTGRCVSLKEICACLRAEGYSDDLVIGRYLSAQLRQLMREANPESHGTRGRQQATRAGHLRG